MDLRGEPWLIEVAPSILLDLRAGTHPRGIAVCTATDTRSGEAAVRASIEASGEDVRIEVRTGEDVGFDRTLDLASLPPHARAVTIASNLDEALRSNWGHLTRHDAPLASDGTLLETSNAVEATEAREASSGETSEEAASGTVEAPAIAETQPGWVGVRVLGSVRAFSTGSVWFDGGAALQVRPIDRLELGLSISGGSALGQSTSRGTVKAERVAAGLEVGLSPISFHEPVRVHGFVRLDISHVWLHGADGVDAVGQSAGGWVVLTEAGAAVSFVIERVVELSIAAWVGAVPVDLYATDGMQRLTGLADFEGGGAIRLEVWP